jgi:hypothetical protein
VSTGLFDLYVAMGGDRYVAHSEAALEATPHGRRVWEVYDRHFGRFTGASLDPLFRRLRHGDRRLSLPRFDAGSAVLVVGDGVLDAARLRVLVQRRDRLIIATTASGEASLRDHGVHADLVLIEPQADDPASPSVSLDPRTAYLVSRSAPIPAGAAVDAVHIAPALPTWGLAPATLVALALEGGAAAVVVTGLASAPGSVATPTEGPDAALRALLDLLALHAPGCLALFDDEPLSRSSAPASGWARGWTSEDLALAAPARLTWIDRGTTASLVEEARADLARVAPIVRDAGRALDAALSVRDGRAPDRSVLRAVETVLAWGADPCLRWSLQQGLGLGFLPRLWRSGISMDPATRQWRPVVLALQELIEQVGRLVEVLEAAPAARTLHAARARGAALPIRSSATRVTAIVPALGGNLTCLRDAVRSLTAQTHDDLEVLVVHDLALAATAADAVCDGDQRVRCVEVGSGSIEEALNQAMALATGDFVAHHDADGVSHPERLARQVAYLRRHPEVDVVAAAAVALDAGDERSSRLCDPRAHTHEALSRVLSESNPIVHGSVMVRREVVLRAGGYRADAEAGAAFDHALWRRLLPESRFAKLPTQLYARRASLGRAAALTPPRASDWHAPAGTERALADPQAGRGLPALELGETHEP